VQSLAEVTRSRHAKYGSTVFHLEPNVKDGPGGLRDYNVACWLALISAMDKLRDWPEARTLLPLSTRKQFESALDFMRTATARKRALGSSCAVHWNSIRKRPSAAGLSMPATAPLRGFYRIKPGVVMPGRARASRTEPAEPRSVDVAFTPSAIKWRRTKELKRSDNG